MITKVECRTPQGVLLILSMEDPSNGFSIDEIEGLGPVKASLFASDYAQLDGGDYQGSRRDARNLVFHIGLHPEFTPDSTRVLRQRIYKWFSPESIVNLRFFLEDGLVVNISGVVETCEPDLFTQEPKIDISVMCYRPDFEDIELKTVTGFSTFLEDEQTFTYEGEAETGIVFKLFLDRDLSDFTIYHRPPDSQIRQLDFAETLLAGDTVIISTIPGQKYARLVRSGATYSILQGVSPQADWLSLMPGDNNIRVYALGDAIPFAIEYYDKYQGL